MITSLLDPAMTIEQREGRPCLINTLYDDLYFAAQDGPAETALVFIEGNQLQDRMKEGRALTVAETGFGTGLNFLVLLKYWQQAGMKAPLHFITTEIAPLEPEVIKEILSPYQELAALTEQMLTILPPRWPGRHRRTLFDGLVTIDFLYGDSLNMINASSFKADAWFLDGFAPSRNPDMWQDDLFKAIADHSAPMASLGSFTAAGHVRRGLEAAGFTITREQGFGHKRHRITGIYNNSQKLEKPRPDQIIVIGAGIAGASTASALTALGHDVLVLGQGDGPADGASGNIAAVQSPRLTADDSFSERLSLSGYSYGRWLARLLKVDLSDQAVSYAWNDREVIRQNKILARDWPSSIFTSPQQDEMAQKTGFSVDHPALLFTDGGAVDPKAFTTQLLEGVKAQYGVVVQHILHDNKIWQVHTNQGVFEADAVVMAAGSGIVDLISTWSEPILPLQVTAGRVSHIPKGQIDLDHALSFGGYMAKAKDGQIALGASFDRNLDMDNLPEIDDALHQANCKTLPQDIAQKLGNDYTAWDGRLSFRLASADRSPIAGDLGNGLYIITALGARGTVTGPLLGQYITALITGAPSPLDLGMASLVDPWRFSKRAGL